MSKQSHAPFAPGFRLPSEANIQAAVGSFPWSDGPHSTMRTHQLKRIGEYSESLLDAVNSPHAYVNRLGNRNQKVWKDLPLPADDLSWLACYCEDGQTFEQFADSITLRSGRFKGCAMVEKPTIYLLPITHRGQWPSSAPSLEALVEWVSVYFSYTVKILDTAFLEKNTNSSERASRHNVMMFRTADHSWPVQGRIEDDKLQTHVNGLLGCLTNIRISEKYGDTQIKDAFAVIGITMCDIYSSHSDLFVAGMACPSTHVGVLSFARYHPHIKMHPGEWTDVGYSKAPSAYPYIETEKKKPNLSSSPPELSVATNAEFLRRAGKLLLHEIGHVLGMDHCIYHNCLMNGTGKIKILLIFLELLMSYLKDT